MQEKWEAACYNPIALRTKHHKLALSKTQLPQVQVRTFYQPKPMPLLGMQDFYILFQQALCMLILLEAAMQILAGLSSLPACFPHKNKCHAHLLARPPI
jgi:hypothetical protein